MRRRPAQAHEIDIEYIQNDQLSLAEQGKLAKPPNLQTGYLFLHLTTI